MMKLFKPTIFFVLASLMLSVSCDKKPIPPVFSTEEKLTLKISPQVKGEPFELNKWYTTPSGQEYMLEQFKFYLGNIELLKSDNSTAMYESIVLAETNPTITGSPQVGLSFEKSNVVIGKYKGIKLGVGVPPSISSASNETYDPSQYTVEHPLSEVYGMTWAWAGYKHIVMQGKYKAIDGTTGNINYHVALDTLYMPTQLTGDISVNPEQNNVAEIAIDVNKIFEPDNSSQHLDLQSENASHSDATSQKSMNVAWKVSNNLAEALELK